MIVTILTAVAFIVAFVVGFVIVETIKNLGKRK